VASYPSIDKEMPDDGAVTGPRVDGLLVRGDVHGCDGLVVPLPTNNKVNTNVFSVCNGVNTLPGFL
jgi:hypothetical protein